MLTVVKEIDNSFNFRSEFYTDNKIYLKGSSFGPLTKRAEDACKIIFSGWEEKGLYGMFDYGWVHCDTPVREKLSLLLGCSMSEVALPA